MNFTANIYVTIKGNIEHSLHSTTELKYSKPTWKYFLFSDQMFAVIKVIK